MNPVKKAPKCPMCGYLTPGELVHCAEMTATDVLVAILRARDNGENPAMILGGDSSLLAAARAAVKSPNVTVWGVRFT